jgi:hypothetical protein
MNTLHAHDIDERVAVTVIPALSPRVGTPSSRPLTARRFMDVLVHPVPPAEMHQRTGTFRPGGKIVIDWPQHSEHWRGMVQGDRLQIDDRRFIVGAVEEFPLCFVNIYVTELSSREF